jgi:hypothetical protein
MMNLKFVMATLMMLLLPSLTQGEPVASASYKDVCKKMQQEGVASRTQTTPASEAVTDNVIVVVGAGSRTSQRHNRPVSNSEIIVGANMTQISTVNGDAKSSDLGAATSAKPCH